MKLHFYVARKFTIAVFGVFAAFFCLLFLLDLVDQIRRFDSDTVSFAQSIELALLAVPKTLYGIFPLIIILGTLAMFLNMARTSELVVIRAAGRSALRSLLAPTLTVLVIGLLVIGVFNPIVAATSSQYALKAARYAAGGASTLSISQEGLWLRQAGAEGQMVIHAERANEDGTQLKEVAFLSFGDDGAPIERIEAETANLIDGAWQISSAKIWDFGKNGTNPEQSALQMESLKLPSDLTRKRIRDSFGAPSSIPIWELPAFIASLESSGFAAREHRVWMHMELALPVMLIGMMMIGAAFTMRHTRFGRTGTMVMFALGLGIGIYFMRNFAQILGESGQIPVYLAAWAPPVASILLALGILLHLEDG